MDSSTYDNVEFPIRRPAGTGTWPGPGQSSASKQQTKDKTGPKLAPLIESDFVDVTEVPEVEDQRQKAQTMTTKTANNTAVVHIDTSSQKTTTHNTVQGNKQSSAIYAKSTKMANPVTSTTAKDNKPLVIMEQPRSPNQEFGMTDLTPQSQSVINNAYTRHKYFYKLNDVLQERGNMLKQGVWDAKAKPGEMMTYEQLIQGMLIDGEKLLLSGGWLYFQGIEFLDADADKTIKEPLGKGRICLTNRKLLLLSAEVNTDATLSEFGNADEPDGGYRLDVCKYNSIYYQNISLELIQSVELNAMVGSQQQSKISSLKPVCCGLFSCVGVGRCSKTWRSTPPMPVTIHRRVLTLGVSMPPWRTPTTMLVYLHRDMPLTTARDFVAQLQLNAAQLQ